ncbi:MAG: hypothetical protein HYZ28_13750 [Myxococcales bacterium]|nr:hypothetical protein [Myxococcales bacterium]
MERAVRMLCFAAALALIACGPRPKKVYDGGEEDAGEDAGVDGGRPAGENPPTGYSVAVEQPATVPATNRLGISVAMALDQNEQPMLAYLHEDPNGDGVAQDGRVSFTRWNGVEKKWEDVRTIETVGQVDTSHPHRQVAIARDSSSGKLGIAYLKSGGQVRLATSDDEGANWTLETASGANPNARPLTDPALGMAGGQTYLAYHEAQRRCAGPACGSVILRSRTGTGAFSDSEAPLVGGAEAQLPMPIALALDSSGKPGVAYFLHSSASATVALGLWRPAGGATKVIDSEGVADATPSVSLAFAGTLPRLAYHLAGSDPAAQLRFSAATDAAGTSWAPAVAIPRNGSVSDPEGTRWYQAVAAQGAKVSIAANFAIATQPSQSCGGPKLARSSNGTDFTVCSPDGGKVFGFAGLWANLRYSSGGKLTLAFLYDSKANPTIRPGVVIWREP